MNKTAIKNFAVEARVMLINAVTQLAYEYEVTDGGKNDPAQESVNGRSLTLMEKNQRSQLITHINIDGFMQTMEEAAYTWFNRFIALRFMEVNNYLPSHTRIFSDESGNFKHELLSQAAMLDIDGLDRELILEMLENQENERLYKYIIITQCNALNDGLPEMFEQIGGWTELLFPRNLLREDSVIAKMINEIPEDDWKDQVQIIGWLYQYYNTEPKDKVFADLKKNIKISAQAIPAATQLFTPDWIVRYMVENSLGRLWTEGHGKPDDADWKYYLDEAKQEEKVQAELEKIRAEYKNIQPEQIKIIDPCMGSGHILVYAFDVLIDIYRSCGWSERDAAKSILKNNIFGLDMRQLEMMMKIYNILGQKYDVVCTNPPYMGGLGMNAKLSEFVKSKFPDSKSDLFACFIEKCGLLAKPHGFYAMITQHAWMFLSSYENLRKKLMMKTTVNMAHLGARAFDEIGGEVVQTTAFVNTGHIADYKGTYARLVDVVGEKEKRELFLSGEKRYAAKQENFSKIPDMPVAYWVSENAFKVFDISKNFESYATTRAGMITGNNNLFIRLWHEVDNHKMNLQATSIDNEESKAKRWYPYNKGGGYRKWYGFNEYLVDWYDDAAEIRKIKTAVIANYQYFMKPGLTWSTLTSGNFSIRWFDEGYILITAVAVFLNLVTSESSFVRY